MPGIGFHRHVGEGGPGPRDDRETATPLKINMQFAKRSSRPRIQLRPPHPCWSPPPPPLLLAVRPVPLLNRDQTVSTPAATLSFFSRILDFQPEWPMRSDLFVFLCSRHAAPAFVSGYSGLRISSVNSICIVKIGNYTVTRVSYRTLPPPVRDSFVSLRFIRPRDPRIPIAPSITGVFCAVLPPPPSLQPPNVIDRSLEFQSSFSASGPILARRDYSFFPFETGFGL